MNIKCPKCDTTYDVSDEIANSGAQVQCAKCSDIFTASPAPDPAEDPGLQDDLDQDIVFQATSEQPDISKDLDEQPAKISPETSPEISDDQTSDEAVVDLPPELLSETEKDFFSSFGSKLSNEEETAENEADKTQEEAERSEPKAADPQEDDDFDSDIGWSEPQEEIAPIVPETPDEFEAIESSSDDGLFADIDQQSEAEATSESTPKIEIEPVDKVEVEEVVVVPPLAEKAIEQPVTRGFASPLLMGWGALAASLVILITGFTTLRVPIVKAVPGMAGLYEKIGFNVNIRGLEFYGLSHQWLNQDGHMRLVVRGEIVNITLEDVAVPEVVFTMIDGSGMEFFQWTERANTKQLAAKDRTRFRAQIPAPADRVRQLKIRFAKR